MSWHNESQRHKLSAYGISTKEMREAYRNMSKKEQELINERDSFITNLSNLIDEKFKNANIIGNSSVGIHSDYKFIDISFNSHDGFIAFDLPKYPIDVEKYLTKKLNLDKSNSMIRINNYDIDDETNTAIITSFSLDNLNLRDYDSLLSNVDGLISNIKYQKIKPIDDAIGVWNKERNEYRNDAEQWLGNWEKRNSTNKIIADEVFIEINKRGDK
jgi:hypothetical protein